MLIFLSNCFWHCRGLKVSLGHCPVFISCKRLVVCMSVLFFWQLSIKTKLNLIVFISSFLFLTIAANHGFLPWSVISMQFIGYLSIWTDISIFSLKHEQQNDSWTYPQRPPRGQKKVAVAESWLLKRSLARVDVWTACPKKKSLWRYSRQLVGVRLY